MKSYGFSLSSSEAEMAQELLGMENQVLQG